MNRRLLAAIGVAVALVPASVYATPSPAPALDTILAPAPGTDWVELARSTSGVFEGPFTAQQYVALGTTANPTAAKTALQQDGFIGGYGKTWVQRSTQHALVEAVVAFGGDVGAKSWLASYETADKADSTYQGPLTTTGLGASYGARYLNPTSKVHADAIVFVKGNDFFVVGTASLQDDKGAAVQAQAAAQYKLAPPYTIPPSAWPKAAPAATNDSFASRVGQLARDAVIAIVLIGLALLAAWFVIRSRRRSAQAAPTPDAPTPDAQIPETPPGFVQLSPDRSFWWDGQAWRDANLDAPPQALRTEDGAFWWDGAGWRQVPPPAS